VTSIVGKHDKVLANRIEWALIHNEPIDQINKAEVVSALDRRLTGLHWP
jgi:hypothetical protein